MIKTVVKANEQLKRSYWARTAIGTALSFCLLAILMWPAQNIYYTLADGNWFLDVQGASVTYTVDNGHTSTDVPQNQLGDFTLVRSPRDRISAYNVVRTFYLKADNRAVLQRTIPDTIEYEQNVDQNIIPLRPEQRPNDLGEYYFCQTVTFKVWQNIEKHATFCSSNYQIIAPTND